MTLTIPAFPDGGQIPVKYSQAAEGVAPGEGTSPAISWANPPAGTQSFVLNMRDMDVARNNARRTIRHTGSSGTFRRRPPACPKVSRRARNWPDGSFQISATGQMYRGPGAPATGPQHHYMFELYALDTKLDVQPTSRRVRDARERHESDARTHPRESGLRRIVPAAQVGVTT